MADRVQSALAGLNPEEQEAWFATLARTVAVDFDGVLHPYTQGWIGSVPDNEPPMPGSGAFLVRLEALGFEIVVFSTRADHDEGRVGIEQWLAKWYGAATAGRIRVTHEKPPAVAYVDDRAVTFRQDSLNWGDCLNQVVTLASGRAHGAAQPPPS